MIHMGCLYMKKTTRLLAFILTLGSLLLIPAAAVPVEEDPAVKIGLAYGNNARPSPKLLNLAGEEYGYSFGWFDKNCDFNEVGYTDIRDIVMLKDTFLYMSEDEEYTDLIPSNLVKTIQPYHLETKTTFESFEEAAINQTLHTVHITVSVDVEIMLPLAYSSITVKTQMPLAQTLIVGRVPQAYLDKK